jgi:Fe-S-cluster containining protein
MIKQLLSSKACLECQGCCRFSEPETIWSPFLLNEDIQELLNHNIPPSIITPSKKIRLLPDSKNNNFICSLLNTQDNKCKIYSFRPFECQLYPFIINRKDKKVFLACDLQCPFAKKNLSTQGFKKYTQYLVNLLNSLLHLKILRDNPQIIQEYSEVSDIAELKI